MPGTQLFKSPKRFAAEERGGITSLSLFLLVTTLMLGGYAIDVSNVMTARTQLQVTADAVAHAALLEREFKTEADAKASALALAEDNMPTGFYGTVLTAEDIVFGDWDPEDRVFTPQPGSRHAVQVRTQRVEDYNNPIRTYLLKLVGLDDWDVVTSAVFTTYYPTCLREGFVAEQPVDLQSNNAYTNGFCIHSNDYVSLNSNNFFEPGTIVSMPDLADIELPNSGFETNEGLESALREGSWNIRIIKRIDDIIAYIREYMVVGPTEVNKRYIPKYITSQIERKLPTRTVEQADLTQGRINTFTCTKGNNTLTIKSNVLVSKVVILTNCEIKFEAGVTIEDAVIATTSATAKSISSSAGLRVGKPDNCAPGGDAQIATLGSMNFPADLELYNAQLLAVGDIEFSARANGIMGAALVAGGTISGTSNMEMAFCGTGMENNFQAEYFKLVQ